jgi:SAM-dependent methyltransferase
MDIIVWGTGDDAVEFLNLCDLANVTVVGFAGDAAEGGESTFLGREIIAPEKLAAMKFDALIITPQKWRPIKDRLVGELGLSKHKVHGYYEKRFRLLKKLARPGLIPEQIPDETLKALDLFPWYHQVEVFAGVKTPGGEPPKLFILDQFLPERIAGKKVLDIGAWNGPFSFDMERRGGDVTAYDIQDPAASGFNLLKELKNSKVAYVRDSVYNLASHFTNHFDIVTFFGVFYHLFNPMLALTNIYDAMAEGGTLLFEGAVLEFAFNVDPVFAGRKDKMAAYTEVPLAYFTSKEYHGDWSNWYVPNVLCLREWLAAAGFETGEIYLLPEVSRAYGYARKLPARTAEHAS